MPLQKLKQELLQRKIHLERQVVTIQHDLRQAHSSDLSEQAQERENDDVLNALEHNAEQELMHINRALQRMEQGDYATCSVCQDIIALERLTAIPYTSLCIQCANRTS
ncbi:TraR/DksA family transcriptional regulator [Alkalimonas collagenimarina]|uniref:TraR/DksA family transcriptional regulator n=1 Tax=Alkalimonas collagenimarina TaxID=400390 RepID=A0ABT9GXL9_9GAMM|nr:TraR/DksA family transcriptional regulator [Alkalimonas collagenimarina]MDP4535806.1 TraR/DksA family transcriptional regulator [Alkalimonas collagenimarina]